MQLTEKDENRIWTSFYNIFADCLHLLREEYADEHINDPPIEDNVEYANQLITLLQYKLRNTGGYNFIKQTFYPKRDIDHDKKYDFVYIYDKEAQIDRLLYFNSRYIIDDFEMAKRIHQQNQDGRNNVVFILHTFYDDEEKFPQLKNIRDFVLNKYKLII